MRKTIGSAGRIRLLFLLFGCLAVSGGAHAQCQLNKRTTVPLTVIGDTIVVPVELNGRPATFILDTGAQRSVVTEAAAARLGLTRDLWVGTTMTGIGGIERRPNADTRSFSLGGVPLARRTLNHDTSLTVSVLPQSAAPWPQVDGLLGRDYLSVFDLDLDMLGHRLTLYQPVGCSGRFLPWGGGYVPIPVQIPTENALIVPVVLDGISLRALLDTGASSSLVAAPGIARLALQPTALSGDPSDQVTGLGPRVVTMRRHRFATLRIGQLTIDRPLIWVAPIRLNPIVDMLLGTDWLAGRQAWISYSTKQIFMAVP